MALKSAIFFDRKIRILTAQDSAILTDAQTPVKKIKSPVKCIRLAMCGRLNNNNNILRFTLLQNPYLSDKKVAFFKAVFGMPRRHKQKKKKTVVGTNPTMG